MRRLPFYWQSLLIAFYFLSPLLAGVAEYLISVYVKRPLVRTLLLLPIPLFAAAQIWYFCFVRPYLLSELNAIVYIAALPLSLIAWLLGAIPRWRDQRRKKDRLK